MILDNLRPGEYRKIPGGVHTINQSVTIPKSVTLDGMPGAVIRTNAPELLQVQSSDVIRGITFEHTAKGRTINIRGNVMQKWRIENCHFINANIAVIAENLYGAFPNSGYGFITNCTGVGSKLCTLEGQRNITISGNKFRNKNGSEMIDLNYNNHYCLIEGNEFINASGYSLNEEVIDMIGGNGLPQNNNIVRNNRIVGNFQTGIRPAKTACNNIIQDNYIEWHAGKIAHNASIYLYGSGAVPSGNKILGNTIVGGRCGIELSHADKNIIDGNRISKCAIGIGLVRNSIYGYDIAPVNNTVTNNRLCEVGKDIIEDAKGANVIQGNVTTAVCSEISPEGDFDLTDLQKVNKVLSGSWSTLDTLRK